MISGTSFTPALPQKELALRPWLQAQAKAAGKTEEALLSQAIDEMKASTPDEIDRMDKLAESASMLRIKPEDEQFFEDALKNAGVTSTNLIQGFVGAIAMSLFMEPILGSGR